MPTAHFTNMSVRMLSAVIDTILMKSGLNNKKYAISHSKDSGGRALLELINLIVQESRALILLVYWLSLKVGLQESYQGCLTFWVHILKLS